MLCDHCQAQEANCHITNVCGNKMEVQSLCGACHNLLASDEVKASIAEQQERIRRTPCNICGAMVGNDIGFVSGGGVPGEEEYEVWCAGCLLLKQEFLTRPENRPPDFPENDDDEVAINEWLDKCQMLGKTAEEWIKTELARRRSKQ